MTTSRARKTRLVLFDFDGAPGNRAIRLCVDEGSGLGCFRDSGLLSLEV